MSSVDCILVIAKLAPSLMALPRACRPPLHCDDALLFTGAAWKVASKDEGLTQKQVAEKLGLYKQTLHDLWHRKSDA